MLVHTMKTMTYDKILLTPGHQYRIKRFADDINAHYKHRLMSMGLLPNAVFSVIRRAPLGQTLEISTGDCHLSLRRQELTSVECEEINA